MLIRTKLSIDVWYEGSFEILITPEYPRESMRQMHAHAVRECASYRVKVIHGRARATRSDMLEFRDHRGMPFGWNKRLVLLVQDLEKNILWPQ